jgi:hypothetical protein
MGPPSAAGSEEQDETANARVNEVRRMVGRSVVVMRIRPYARVFV